MRQQSRTAFALRSLSAADLAPALADQIQAIHEQNLAIARETTIWQARAMVKAELSKLPSYLEIELDENELIQLVNNLFKAIQTFTKYHAN